MQQKDGSMNVKRGHYKLFKLKPKVEKKAIFFKRKLMSENCESIPRNVI